MRKFNNITGSSNSSVPTTIQSRKELVLSAIAILLFALAMKGGIHYIVSYSFRLARFIVNYL